MITANIMENNIRSLSEEQSPVMMNKSSKNVIGKIYQKNMSKKVSHNPKFKDQGLILRIFHPLKI